MKVYSQFTTLLFPLQLADTSDPYNGLRAGVQRSGLLSFAKLIINNEGVLLARFPHTQNATSQVNSDVIATFEAGDVSLKKGGKMTSLTRQLRIDANDVVIESGLIFYIYSIG